MKKLVTLLTILLLASHTRAQTPNKYNDNVNTLDGIMKAYYDVVTVKKGGKISFERDSLLHWPNVSVGFSGMSRDGKPTFRYVSLKEYHRLSDAGLERNGFDEHEISRKTEKFGSLYHVWSTYESRNVAGGPVIERGINSIELYFDGTRFWILGWFFDGERKDNPIPKEYLN